LKEKERTTHTHTHITVYIYEPKRTNEKLARIEKEK